ncbi:conserved hypothetical protein [uncultured Paludibacter sp.]|nr:conserved hypothetical protein [uncultured Paludibacter sp.]
MLKEILSITGKSGLYKLVSQGKNMLIVESLIDGSRIPAFAKDKAVSLGDIAIFTDTEEVPLGEVLEKIKEKEKGEKCSINPKSDNDILRKYLGEVLPDFDRDRVYPSDIRKLLNWYNILTDAKMTDFVVKEEEQEKTEEKPEGKEEIKEKKKASVTSTAKKTTAHQNVKTTQSKAATTTRTNRSNRGV